VPRAAAEPKRTRMPRAPRMSVHHPNVAALLLTAVCIYIVAHTLADYLASSELKYIMADDDDDYRRVRGQQRAAAVAALLVLAGLLLVLCGLTLSASVAASAAPLQPRARPRDATGLAARHGRRRVGGAGPRGLLHPVAPAARGEPARRPRPRGGGEVGGCGRGEDAARRAGRGEPGAGRHRPQEAPGLRALRRRPYGAERIIHTYIHTILCIYTTLHCNLAIIHIINVVCIML